MVIMRGTTTITAAVLAVCIVAMSRPTSGAGLERLQKTMLSTVARITGDDGTVKINATAVTARLIQDYVTPAICTYVPGSCVQNRIRKSRA